MSEDTNTTWVRFTKPTANYAVGDVVELTDEEKDVLDAVITKHFKNDRKRYEKTSAPKQPQGDVPTGLNTTAAKTGVDGNVAVDGKVDTTNTADKK